MHPVSLNAEDLPRYTYKDYAVWEGGWEIIRGIPYAMVPAPVIKHQRLSKKIAWQLEEQLEYCEKCEVFLPVDWQVSEDTVVQPDVLVVCSEDDYVGDVKLEITPVIVFEVLSPASSRKDRIVKYRLYESAGVKYYCIVDPGTNSADVFVLQKEKYRELEDFDEGLMSFDLGPCRVQLDFGEIFR
ncbi:MAG: Uma2 family endonuclease [Candidatus Aminicenantes bacterium]|nr:Uma2 family endonuclease [Candidatus Aminicenantes bacterium]